MQSTDPQEIERFSKLAAQWWDADGPLKPLHELNPLRLAYIRDLAMRHFARTEAAQPLTGLRVLDIGCGGGLVCEPMARLGAQVTGIDAAEKNIGVARAHAAAMGLSIDYRCTTAEELLSSTTNDQRPTTTFDIVLALEIIEHVANPAAFVQSCAALARPGGLIIFSTLNRTAKAFALAIVGAEYVLRWLPRGTHTWSKFVKPSELSGWLHEAGAAAMEVQGMALNPLSFQWKLAPDDVSVNYLLAAKKQASGV